MRSLFRIIDFVDFLFPMGHLFDKRFDAFTIGVIVEIRSVRLELAFKRLDTFLELFIFGRLVGELADVVLLG